MRRSGLIEAGGNSPTQINLLSVPYTSALTLARRLELHLSVNENPPKILSGHLVSQKNRRLNFYKKFGGSSHLLHLLTLTRTAFVYERLVFLNPGQLGFYCILYLIQPVTSQRGRGLFSTVKQFKDIGLLFQDNHNYHHHPDQQRRAVSQGNSAKIAKPFSPSSSSSSSPSSPSSARLSQAS